jgi:hypothetical protein
MLSELGVSVILEASITGAGLVLAVYALLTPLSSRIFNRRVEKLEEKIKEFDETKNKISSESDLEIEKLKNLQSEIKEFKIMPVYFRMQYILAPFMLFLFSVALASGYLESFGTSNAIYDFAVYWTFALAIATFFAIGIAAIIGTHVVMKEEFESIKKKQKEVKETKVNTSVSVVFRGDAEVKEKKNG